MNLTPEQIYPIADFQKWLSDRKKIDLSPIEVAEILWLAVQRSEGIVSQERSSKTPEPLEEPLETSSQPLVNQSSTKLEIKANIFVKPPKPPEGTQKASTPLPVKIPEAVALRNRREISKSLRPLMRKVPSRYRQSIDEEATAIQIAEDKIWSPVVSPEPERWLELAIVIEVTNLFDVWQDTIEEFRHLLERHGAFRDVRTWQLQTSGTGKPQLFLRTSRGLNRQPRSPRELLDAGGRRLVLFLSDCTSRAWRSGKIFKLLQLWSKENPVTIGQLLPEHYWDRSALSLGTLVALRSPLAGALSRDWLIEGLSLRRRQRLQGGIRLPVVTLQPHSLGWWAQAMAAVWEQQTTGIVFKAEAFQEAENISLEPISAVGIAHPTTLTARQLVQRFRGTASEKAQELADMMAVLPVNWSVLRLLQKNLVQNSSDSLQEPVALYLAEIFLSGLLCPVPEIHEQKPKRSPQYDFVSGVRSILLGAIPISEARSVGEEIAQEIFRQLPSEVQERVNADIKKRSQESLSYFEAFLLPDLPWGEDAMAEMLPFAQVTGDVLRRWGGDYAALAEELEQTTSIPSDPVITEPDPSTSIELETFSYEVGMLEIVKSRNLLRQESKKFQIKKQTQQGQQFVEKLPGEITLEMVAIAAGKFIMGAPETEEGSTDDERPQHEVNISGFLMGKYPITQAQWRVVAGMPQIERELKPDPSRFKGNNLPVEQVSWLEAVEFCARLSNHTKREYRLPSEAEWEYACRAMPSPPRNESPRLDGTFKYDGAIALGSIKTTGQIYPPFHFGETITPELVNYDGNRPYGEAPKGEDRNKTTPVGSFPANAFGLHDMHGNVWEWCEDDWHSHYTGAPIDGRAWVDKNNNRSQEEDAQKLLRGGSWINNAIYCRSAYRNHSPARVQYYSVGFRVVCALR